MTEAPIDPRIGRVIAGKYEIVEPLGHGGMGAVYRGRHRVLGGDVAVKFLHRVYLSTHELRARFEREAVALSRLRHPGIVALLDYGVEDDGELFMVLEVVEGATLAHHLTHGPLSLPFIGDVFDRLLEVLALAHEAGIVHRDLKPTNVMIIPPDHVKLLDFGLVQLPGADLDKLTETGIAHGTPEYMSPEQCQGEEIGPPADVYALGVTLYECLAGRAPFVGEGAGRLMAAHLFVSPPPIASERGVPEALEALVQRALAKAPERRPSAPEMRQELAEIMHGTDPGTLAALATKERGRLARTGRDERGLTGRAPPKEAESSLVEGTAVLLRISDRRRAEDVRSALAVGGIDVVVPGEREAGVVVIVSARDGIAAITQAVAEKLPTLVIDVATLDEMRACVREGASDMLMVESDDAELATRIRRLLRRSVVS